MSCGQNLNIRDFSAMNNLNIYINFIYLYSRQDGAATSDTQEKKRIENNYLGRWNSDDKSHKKFFIRKSRWHEIGDSWSSSQGILSLLLQQIKGHRCWRKNEVNWMLYRLQTARLSINMIWCYLYRQLIKCSTFSFSSC